MVCWFAEPLWTDPGIKSGISVHELISASPPPKKKKKVQAGNEWSNILPKSSLTRKKLPQWLAGKIDLPYLVKATARSSANQSYHVCIDGKLKQGGLLALRTKEEEKKKGGKKKEKK